MAEKEKIEIELAKPEVYTDTDKLLAQQQLFEKTDTRLEEENKKWESVALEIEEVERG